METWINEPIQRDVRRAVRARRSPTASSAWLDGRLVGGLYGVALGGAFFGESMFSIERDASKVALAHLVARLKVGGFTLLDTQFLTEHLSGFGAEEISRGRVRRAAWPRALALDADFGRMDPYAGGGGGHAGDQPGVVGRVLERVEARRVGEHPALEHLPRRRRRDALRRQRRESITT